MKICKKCGVEKSISEFTKHINTRDKLKSWCKSCMMEYERERRMRNPEKQSERNRKTALKRYNLDIDGYNAILNKQHGACAICGNKNNGKSFHVDHNHQSNLIRGLLCSNCNMALGLLKDNSNIVLRMFDYLEDNEDLPFTSLIENGRQL